MEQSLKNIFFAILLQTSNFEAPSQDAYHTSSFSYQNVHKWGDKFPECYGRLQSPININPAKISIQTKPSKLKFVGYDILPKSMKLKNNGHTVKLYAKWKGSPPYVSGDRLITKYIFDSLHFHWGQNKRHGSEHKFANKSFPIEMHMVHYNKKYHSAEEAARHKNSFLVIGIVFEISNTQESHFSPLKKSLSLLNGPSHSKNVEPFKLSNFNLRPITGYIMYMGSLTTPPCSENVVWLLNTHVLTITNPEIKLFRTIKLAHGDKSNYRPIQHLHKRRIFYYPKY